MQDTFDNIIRIANMFFQFENYKKMSVMERVVDHIITSLIATTTNSFLFYFNSFVRTLCPWRGHLLHAVVTAELSSPCCILLPGGVEWTGETRRDTESVKEGR